MRHIFTTIALFAMALPFASCEKEIIVNYAVGDTVSITDGPLENFSGTVDEIDQEKNMVRVTISMFGRETSVELELDQVERLD